MDRELGPFRLESELGRGGMGVVYRALQVGLDRAVALKLLSPDAAFEGELRGRFEAEARLAARVRHPAIVQVIDFGVAAGGQPYIAYELVEGRPLSAILDEGAPPQPAARAIARDLVGALAALHEAGIVHRDLKPGNVLIDRAGHARLTDLGIALEIATRVRRTAPGVLLATPEFVAPELLREERPTPAADVYAAGVLMFALATGRLPFEADSLADLLRAHLETPPPEAGRVNPAADPLLARLAKQALAKDPAERPTARELVTAFGDTAGVPRIETVALQRESAASAKLSTARLRRPPPAKPRRRVPFAAFAVVAALAIGAVVGLATRPRPRRIAPPPSTVSPVPSPEEPARELLTAKWRRIVSELPGLASDSADADRVMNRCKRLTGLDMESPARWRYWVELSRWLEDGPSEGPVPASALELGSALYTMVDAQGDEAAITGTMARSIFSKPKVNEGEALAFAVLCVGTAPDDTRSWLLLGRSYDVDGRPALAKKAYARALQRGRPRKQRDWPHQIWYGAARAMQVVEGHDLTREYWVWAADDLESATHGLRTACSPELFERVRRSRP